jgi:rod shape-determining protein MreC
MTLRERAPRRRALTYVAIVGACLALLAVGRSEPAQELRRGVHFAVSPMQDALAGGTRSITQVLGAFAEIDRLRQENRSLRAQVEQLRQQVAQLEVVREENTRLSRALRTQRIADHETVAADVVARESTQFERGITLDRGEEAGIELGDAVLSDGGALVGSVIEVGQGYSLVRLITDTRSLVVGLDARTRATGEIEGRLAAPLEMAAIRITDEVSVGHQVETAGLSVGRRFKSPFPKGLLVGSIIDVQHEPGSVVQTALVQPAADMERLETVLVVTDYEAPRRPEATPLEEGS